MTPGTTAEAGIESLDPAGASLKAQFVRPAGTLPPLAANWLSTCLMSQTFIVDESLLSPV